MKNGLYLCANFWYFDDLRTMRHIAVLLVIFQSLICFPQPSSSEVINRTSHFMLNSNGMVQADTVMIQINDRHADTEILIPYSKGDKVNVDNVWIEYPAGNIIRKLKKNEIKDRSFISSISLYEDDFVKYFDLKHDQYPYRIYYTSRINYAKSLNIIDIDHSRGKTPVRSATLIVEVPLGDSIRYRYKNAGTLQIDTQERYKKYSWKYGYTPPFSIEIYGLDEDLKAPSIHIVPLHFKYGESGSFASWQSFGNWVFRLNKNKDKLTAQEQQRVDNLLRVAGNKRQKVEILYRYLQDYTRYINVSIKLGGLQTYPASYVCENKYGDCKALTNYLQSMLKYAGIKSYYTLIKAGTKIPDLEVDFPSQAFNHAILTVPLEEDTVFLECTDKNIPFGYMGTFTQGRQALLIDEDESRLIQVPALQPEEVLCSRTINIKPDVQEIHLSEVQRGYRYEFFNYAAKELGKDKVEETIRNHIFSGKAELIDYHLNPANGQSAEISLAARFKIDNIYKEYGKNIILPPFPIGVKNFETPDQRTIGVQLDYPEFYKDTVIYDIAGKQISTIPEKVSIETDFGNYEIYFELKGNTLVCCKSFFLYAGKYPFERYDEFFRFIQMVKNNETKNIHIETL